MYFWSTCILVSHRLVRGNCSPDGDPEGKPTHSYQSKILIFLTDSHPSGSIWHDLVFWVMSPKMSRNPASGILLSTISWLECPLSNCDNVKWAPITPVTPPTMCNINANLLIWLLSYLMDQMRSKGHRARMSSGSSLLRASSYFAIFKDWTSEGKSASPRESAVERVVTSHFIQLRPPQQNV